MKITNHHRALIGLLSVPDFGLRRVKTILQATQVTDASDIFKMKLPDLLRIDGFGEHIAKNLTTFDGWKQVDKVLEKTEKCGAELLAFDDENYPPMLRHIFDPPPILWLKGDKTVLSSPGLAVIGTRQPGKYGLEQTAYWTKLLVQKNICINSGLAYGIDAKAHQTAVDANGKTVAVLGSGIDFIYPRKNSRLAEQILETGGAVLSEFPPGTAPDAVNFPARNRIVSGMSHGVLVVESGVKGGSMITARSALDQNREVFVVPHPLGYMKGEGCNYLIRTGQGKLIQSLADILDEISIQTEPGPDSVEIKTGWKDLELSKEGVEICILLEKKELHIDQLSEATGKSAFKLLPLLLELEMTGAVKQKAGKYFEVC